MCRDCYFQSGLTASRRISRPVRRESTREIRHRNLSARESTAEFLGNGFEHKETRKLKWRKYDTCACSIRCSRCCIHPAKLHGEYVTLYAHKDRLIAHKITTRALCQRLSVRFKWSPARFTLRMLPLFRFRRKKKKGRGGGRKIGKRRFGYFVPFAIVQAGLRMESSFTNYYGERKKYEDTEDRSIIFWEMSMLSWGNEKRWKIFYQMILYQIFWDLANETRRTMYRR